MNIFWYILAAFVLLNLISFCFKDYRRQNDLKKSMKVFDFKEDFKLHKGTGLKRFVEVLKLIMNIVQYPIGIVIMFFLDFLFMPVFYWLQRLYYLFKPDKHKRYKAKKPEHNKYYEFHSEKVWDLESKKPGRFLFRCDMPFIPNDHQIIYIENSYDPFYNQYICENLSELREYFASEGYEFCYLPSIGKIINADAHYYSPTFEGNVSNDSSNMKSDLLIPYLVDAPEIKPGLIRYLRKEEGDSPDKDTFRFSYFTFLPPSEVSMEQQITTYISLIGFHGTREMYCLKPNSPDEKADNDFSSDIKQLMDEVSERVEKLRLHGVSELVLKNLLQPEKKLSRLIITKSSQIFLPDYNNMEIQMTPLPKAVFFLFLRHPEGILFKNLVDYRDELTRIYGHLTGRQDMKAVKKSICDITDPTQNSINEKCARIREAFVRNFDDHLAQNYYVTGNRGEAKTIILPRDLVEWQDK
jgi:hypothetical protein